MSKLQKSAWINLIAVTLCVLVTGILFSALTKANTKGIHHLFIFVICGSLSGLSVFVGLRKKGLEAGFDERERAIYNRASIWSSVVLMLYLACVCLIPFFVLGGRSTIPTYILPIIFLSSSFNQ